MTGGTFGGTSVGDASHGAYYSSNTGIAVTATCWASHRLVCSLGGADASPDKRKSPVDAVEAV